jgi:hypothetical protein
MTAGLPGVGIGGIFYLASALLMPMRSAVAVLSGRGDEARWPVALRQASLAGGILGALWLTGWALGWIITAFVPEAATATAGAGAGEVRNVVKVGALVLSLGTLAAVLAVVQLVRIALPPRPTPRNAAATRNESARSAA